MPTWTFAYPGKLWPGGQSRPGRSIPTIRIRTHPLSQSVGVGDAHRDRVALQGAHAESGGGLAQLGVAAEAPRPGDDIVIRHECGCAAAPLAVDADPDLGVGGDVVRPACAAAVLRDHPDAAVVGAA